MSEQAKILEDLEKLIMEILKMGTATIEQGEELDTLEGKLFKQKCFKEIEHADYDNQGEEIASLFFSKNNEDAIAKMIECEIDPEDFFGFAQYHYDEDEDPLVNMFTPAYIADISKNYQLTYDSK